MVGLDVGSDRAVGRRTGREDARRDGVDIDSVRDATNTKDRASSTDGPDIRSTRPH